MEIIIIVFIKKKKKTGEGTVKLLHMKNYTECRSVNLYYSYLNTYNIILRILYIFVLQLIIYFYIGNNMVGFTNLFLTKISCAL